MSTLTDFEGVCGPERYEVAVNLNHLALVHQARGETAEAEQLYLRALTIQEKILGPDHPDLAVTFQNLAALFAGSGRLAAARAIYRHALGIFVRTLGPAHPRFLACRDCYEDLGRFMRCEIGRPLPTASRQRRTS